MKLVVKEHINGGMVRPTLVNGLTTKCMARDNSIGLMENSTLGTSLKIKEVAKDSSSGKMGENMKENGSMGNNMGLETIEILKESKEKDNGKMERESHGFLEFSIFFNYFNEINILIVNQLTSYTLLKYI
jgi:hypothetical protein